MMRHSMVTACALLTAFAATPAWACAVHEPLNPRAALGADLVVVGRIINHAVDPNGGDHFDVVVAEVLRDSAGRSVSVRHSDRMLGPMSSLPRRPVLIALRRDGAGYAIMWHICSDPFLLPAGSAQAMETRRLLRQPGNRR